MGGGGGGSKVKDKAKDEVINADISTMEIDESVSFASIGGLDGHIRSLKESVFLPLTYPEVFEKLGVKAPGGVLFHGPPGTGKTMMARALANSCSQGLLLPCACVSVSVCSFAPDFALPLPLCREHHTILRYILRTHL